MDGRTVLRKALGSWLGRIFKDQSYEMRVTDDGGIEVTRAGRVQWRWRLSDREAEAARDVERRRRWGVAADDIMD